MKLRHSAGFTLFELVVAMAVLSFLVAMVFELLTTFVSATQALQLDQSRLDQALALQRFLSSRVETITADSHLLSVTLDSNTSSVVIANQQHYLALEIDQSTHGLSMSYRTASFSNPSTPATEILNGYRKDRPDVEAVVLLHNLKDAQWRFFDRPSGKWFDSWTFLDRNPSIAELSFTMDGDQSPTVFDFPVVQLAPNPDLFVVPLNSVAPLTTPNAH